MERLDDITERISTYLETKNQARDQALARSRELIRSAPTRSAPPIAPNTTKRRACWPRRRPRLSRW